MVILFIYLFIYLSFLRDPRFYPKALVDISRGLDGGFLTFVLPIILDGIFHKLAPALFMPNVIQMMLNPDWSFSAVGAPNSNKAPYGRYDHIHYSAV